MQPKKPLPIDVGGNVLASWAIRQAELRHALRVSRYSTHHYLNLPRSALVLYDAPPRSMELVN